MSKFLAFLLISMTILADPYIPSISIKDTEDVKQELKKISKVINGSLGAGNVKDRSFSSDKLLETGVTAGSYLNANITVDSKGRLSSAGYGCGTPPNYTSWESDGTMVMNGNATVWEDLQFPLAGAKLLGTSDDPTFSKICDNGSGSTGIYAYSFSATALKQVWVSNGIPHSWKEGTNFKIHLHFYPATNDAGDIIFEVEHVFNDLDEVLGSSTVSQYTYTVPANSALKHLYVDIVTITGTNLKVSHGIGLRVCRRGDLAGDNYAGACWITRAGIHYESDTLGSRSESIK